ncbi:MAG TPA: hypothetical protein VHA70_07260 [Bauldia sp.]|nr:hypothetical protein [Bauldia sp.]
MRHAIFGFGLAALAFAASPALADGPAETALLAWIDGIDASPDWTASYGSVTTDPATQRTVVSGLIIASAQAGFALHADRVTVDGYTAGDAATFAASEIDIDGGRIDAGVYSIRLDHAKIEAPELPLSGGFAWDPTHPFVSAVHAFAPLLTAKANGATVNTLSVVETLANVATWSTYRNVKLEGLHDGKIAAMSATDLRTDSPGVDPAGPAAAIPPLVSMKAKTAETRDVDLGAFFAVYDLARYANGIGDEAWHTAVGNTRYDGVTVDVPGVAIAIGSVTMGNFSVRQPKVPPDFDAVPATDDRNPLHLLVAQLKQLHPFGIGAFSATDFSITAPGIDAMKLGKLSLTATSTDAVGSFALENAEAALTGQGGVKIGKLGFGGLTVPSSDAISAALEAQRTGGDIDFSSLIPPLSYVEADAIDVGLAAIPTVKLGHFRADLGNYVDKVPTSVSGSLAGADVPASLVPDARAQQLLAKYGYDRVVVDGGGKATWAPNGDVTVRDFSLGMKGVGMVSGEADISAPPPADAAHMAAVISAPETVSLKRGAVSFKDDSLVEKAITAQATALNLDPAKFREQFAKGLPFMLMLLGNKDLQAQLAGVLQTFIRTPGTITATAAPAAPVTLATIIEAAKTAPFSLFDLLKVSVTGVAGPAPATPPPAQ